MSKVQMPSRSRPEVAIHHWAGCNWKAGRVDRPLRGRFREAAWKPVLSMRFLRLFAAQPTGFAMKVDFSQEMGQNRIEEIVRLCVLILAS